MGDFTEDRYNIYYYEYILLLLVLRVSVPAVLRIYMSITCTSCVLSSHAVCYSSESLSCKQHLRQR
jgi:hypothetical protein